MVGTLKETLRHREETLARELATLIEETFGTDPFTYREMNEAVNPLTRQDHTSGSVVIHRYTQAHVHRLVEVGTLEFTPRTRRYQLNILKTYQLRAPAEAAASMIGRRG